MAARKDHAGRPGGSELTRLMLAILGGLTEDGDMVNVHAVARRFSNSDDFAERLIESIKVLPAGDDFFLPLYFKDGDPDVALVEGGVRGRRLRLTRDETFALIAAFDRIGISEGNSLRKSIMGTMASLDVSTDETQRTDAPSGGSDTTALERCVQALCTGRRIRFLYQGRLDSQPNERHAEPTGVHQSDGAWYVDAYDVVRGGPRIFRSDRMSQVEDDGPATQRDNALQAQERLVTVRFSDPSVLVTLWWPKLEVIEEREGYVEARLPYYGGDWLARRLAACGGTATTDDPELAERTRLVAEGLLATI